MKRVTSTLVHLRTTRFDVSAEPANLREDDACAAAVAAVVRADDGFSEVAIEHER